MNRAVAMNREIVILLMLGAIAWLWHNSRTVHEKVLGISRKVCREINVQLLDDTVCLRRFGLTWVRQRPAVRRIYGFEFSGNGVDRNSGEIGLIGLRLDWVRINHPDGDYYMDLT